MKVLASHQPNFLPYMGYFYKMYVADEFSIADEVQFTRSVHHNYNYIWEQGSKKKLTVPVSSHSSPFKETELIDWKYHKCKILKRIKQAYSKYPHFEELYPVLESIMMKDYKYLIDLNIATLQLFKTYLKIRTPWTYESSLGLKYGDPNEDILDVCKKLKCDAYVTGSGSVGYMKPELFEQNGVKLFWTQYQPTVNQYGAMNMSVLDYIMSEGSVIPEQWKKDRELIHNGI